MTTDVDPDRLRKLTLELVQVESPTGDTAEVARLYGRRLEEYGLEVELLDDVFPATPIVVGRLRGGEPGPTVVLNGHLDTVPIPHEPPRVEGETIYGRGTADMKGALACAAEAARVLAERGSFPGALVIVAIGMHEAPDGRGEDLTYLLGDGGFTADLGSRPTAARPSSTPGARPWRAPRTAKGSFSPRSTSNTWPPSASAFLP